MPENFSCYWYDLREDERVLLKRQNGGSSVMVWGTFAEYGVSASAFLSEKQKGPRYIETLGKH